MFLYLFLGSCGILCVGVFLQARLMYKLMKGDLNQEHALFWALPFLFMGMLGGIVSVVLKLFGYIA